LGVAIHPEKQNEILRPMVKELAQSDIFELWPKNSQFFTFFKKQEKYTVFWPYLKNGMSN